MRAARSVQDRCSPYLAGGASSLNGMISTHGDDGMVQGNRGMVGLGPLDTWGNEMGRGQICIRKEQNGATMSMLSLGLCYFKRHGDCTFPDRMLAGA